MSSILFKSLHPDARLPIRRPGDVGWDLYAVSAERLTDTLQKVHTGLAMQLPPGYWGQIENRSSMGKNGFAVHGGIVDNAYRGEIIVLLAFHNPLPMPLAETGSRIAQLVVRRQEDAEWTVEWAPELSDSERGAGGFGSTGK